MFLLLCAIAGLGILIKFILIPGKDRWAVYGRQVDLEFWGLDRHEWGSIHLLLAVLVLILLIFHIILHWNAIICIYKTLICSKFHRGWVFIVFITACMLLLVFPFLVNIEIMERGNNNYTKEISVNLPSGNESRADIMGVNEDTTKNHHTGDRPFRKEKNKAQHVKRELHKKKELHHEISQIEIRGYMTLAEVSAKYDIPVDSLKSCLEIPLSESNDIWLGGLRKKYGFKISALRKYIDGYCAH